MSSKNLKGSESSREKNGRFVKGSRNSINTEFKNGQHWRPEQEFRKKEYLIEEYVLKKRSTSEIANDFGVTDSAIIFWLRKHGIARRTISEARKIKKWGVSGKSNPMYGRCGSENPRWIDGSSPERQKMYARSFWKDISKFVLDRDGYKCKKCGATKSSKNKLHAHHIKPWAGNPDYRFELSNIITVCQSCHNWIHSKENVNNEFLS